MICLGLSAGTFAQDSVYYELWNIDNLENIGGHTLTYTGNPQVVVTDSGTAVQFDGDEDRLQIDANPIGEAKEFTVEMVFWPEACYPDNTDPRFVHIQDPNDSQAKRVMIELRVNSDNKCYMDGFMLTDKTSLALIDETLVHPTETWSHVAVTYKDGTFTTYFNGVEELSGVVGYDNSILGTEGKTSLGGRMDNRNYFKGKIKTFKVTRAALDPEDFLINQTSVDTKKKQLKTESEFKVFPVPADQSLILEVSDSDIKTTEIQIMDSTGRIFHSGNYNISPSSQVTINTSSFQPGLYVVRMNTGSTVESCTIIVQH